MSNQINLVQGDTGPDVVVTLYDATNNAPIDVSNAGTVVSLKYRMEGSSSVLSITGVKTNGGLDGIVSFTWPTNALDKIGAAEGEIKISFNTGKVETVPDKLIFNTRSKIA